MLGEVTVNPEGDLISPPAVPEKNSAQHEGFVHLYRLHSLAGSFPVLRHDGNDETPVNLISKVTRVGVRTHAPIKGIE